VVTALFEGFEFPPTAVLALRALGLTAVASSPTTTAVLVEAADVWVTPRPASERVPALARVVEVGIVPSFRLTGRRRPVTRRFLVTARAKVKRLIAAANALPAAQPGTENCPLENGSMVTLGFRATRRGADLAVVRAQLSGCAGVSFTVGGRVQPPLADGSALGRTVDRGLGV
jgi:hypothetical protein